MAEMVAGELRKAGYEVTLSQMDLSTLAGKVSQHDFDMYMGAWAGSFYLKIIPNSGIQAHGQMAVVIIPVSEMHKLMR